MSGTTKARWRERSCVATPVGQRSVWQLSDWMQPSENMKPRAELHQSAPIAIARAMLRTALSDDNTLVSVFHLMRTAAVHRARGSDEKTTMDLVK